jgi:hypothetical protein
VDLPTVVIVAIPSALLIGVIAQRLARRVRAIPAASSSASSVL